MDAPKKLVTVAEAFKPYSISKRHGLTFIHRGLLPAVRAGRCYLVDPADVAALLRPTVQQPPPSVAAKAKESPSERAARQLRAAGVRV